MLSSRDFAELAALYRLDPWGEERADLRSGLAATAIAAGLGAKFELADFMPFAERGKPAEQTAEEIERLMEGF